MRMWFVRLDLIIGEFEKASMHIVTAENEKLAGKKAIEDECHDTPDWENDKFDECWDCGQMVYQVNTVIELPEHNYKVLNHYMNYGEAPDEV
jgi:hypothetical protein